MPPALPEVADSEGLAVDLLYSAFRGVAGKSLHGFASREQPGLRVMRETNVRVIILRRRRGEQQKRRLDSAGGLGTTNQFLSNAFSLV